MIDKEQLSTYLKQNPRFDVLLRLVESGEFDTPSNHLLREAAERAEQVIRTIHSEIGQDIDINSSAKRVYLSQMLYVGDQLSKSLNTSVTADAFEANDRMIIDAAGELGMLVPELSVDRVRAAIEAIEDATCDDFSERAQQINLHVNILREALGILLPPVEVEDEE